MKKRRFMLLAVALVALNTFFWLAAGGFALPRGIVNQFFGNRLIRAEVLLQAPAGVQDWRIDRGVVLTAAAGGTSLTLREGDGTVVTLSVSPSARVEGRRRITSVAQLRKRLRLVIYHQANLPAELVQVEAGGG